jgi:hypothetical protein
MTMHNLFGHWGKRSLGSVMVVLQEMSRFKCTSGKCSKVDLLGLFIQGSEATKAWHSCRTIMQRNPDDGGWSMEGGGGGGGG